MPEILPSHVPSPRTLLAWDGTAYRPIHIDALGNVQIDVVASALPAGAATAAAQALALAQLQTIAEIRDALQSVNTDALQVRGEDQLFSIKGVIHQNTSGAISGADGYIELAGPGAGYYWVITNARARDATSPVTQILIGARRGGANQFFHQEIAAIAADQRTFWDGMIVLDASDDLRAYFIGALAGDTVSLGVRAYYMTIE